MCVDSLLLKFNSDEKQFTQLFISVFASDCILSTTKGGPPCGGGWTLHSEIEMTINLPGHPMSVTQCYLAMNDAHLLGLSTHLHHFQVIDCDVYVFTPSVYDCLCAVILVSSVVLWMSLLFLFWNGRLPFLGRSRVEHTHKFYENIQR